MKLELLFPLAVFVFVILWGLGGWHSIPVREMINLAVQIVTTLANVLGSIIH